MGRVANNIIRIPTSLSGKFFRYWFEFLKPICNLTNREVDVISSFVKHRYELSKVINDSELLDRITMDEDTKKKVREECNISPQHFQVIMGKLRKSKAIVDNKINPKFIPNVEKDSNGFKLMLVFELSDLK